MLRLLPTSGRASVKRLKRVLLILWLTAVDWVITWAREDEFTPCLVSAIGTLDKYWHMESFGPSRRHKHQKRYRASCVQLDLFWLPWPTELHPQLTPAYVHTFYSSSGLFPHQYPRTPTDRFTTAPKPSISSVTPRTTTTDHWHGDLAGFGRNTSRGF